jgi:hypothetical protein
MFDFDPRDVDSRDDDWGRSTSRGSREGSGDGDRDDDWKQPGRSRDRGDDARTLGRGPGNDRASAHAENDARDRRDDARWLDRDREPRERPTDRTECPLRREMRGWLRVRSRTVGRPEHAR